MSIEYDRYLKEHIRNVGRAYTWILGVLKNSEFWNSHFSDCFNIQNMIDLHDKSKYESVEYLYYDKYFYPNQQIGSNKVIGRSVAVTSQFNRAFLTHIHRNPHHWQYWVLIHDDPNEEVEALEMPIGYLVEMVCDWMSFGISKGEPGSIFDFYLEHRAHILLNQKTRYVLESILHVLEIAVYNKNEKGEYTCEFWKAQ